MISAVLSGPHVSALADSFGFAPAGKTRVGVPRGKTFEGVRQKQDSVQSSVAHLMLQRRNCPRHFHVHLLTTASYTCSTRFNRFVCTPTPPAHRRMSPSYSLLPSSSCRMYRCMRHCGQPSRTFVREWKSLLFVCRARQNDSVGVRSRSHER